MIRPICQTCNKNCCAVNYKRNEVTHYRKMCDDCRKKPKNRKRVYAWERAGYKKKPTCECCGFKSLYASQMMVFHIDGNLENVAFNNLRTICLNCVEVIKRKEVNWRRGDLMIDY